MGWGVSGDGDRDTCKQKKICVTTKQMKLSAFTDIYQLNCNTAGECLFDLAACTPACLTQNTDTSNNKRIGKLVCLASMDLLLAGRHAPRLLEEQEERDWEMFWMLESQGASINSHLFFTGVGGLAKRSTAKKKKKDFVLFHKNEMQVVSISKHLPYKPINTALIESTTTR